MVRPPPLSPIAPPGMSSRAGRRSAWRRRLGSLLDEPIRQAVSALDGHRLRSALSAAAIAVAVATVVIVLTALEGVEAFARTTAARTFGSNTFVLAQIASQGQISRTELARKLERNRPILRPDTRALDRLMAGRVLIAPTTQSAADIVVGSRRFENASVNGAGAALEQIRDVNLSRGRFFRPDEEQRAAQVAVIGADVATTVFPDRDPIDAVIRIKGRGFRVVGVQAPFGSGGAAFDRYVWIPLPAHERTFGAPRTLQVFAMAGEGHSNDDAEALTRTAMRAHRQLQPGVEDTFDLLTPEAARGFVARLSERISIAAVPIALITVLVAIVVVTNTMLVSVSERTRDIGVRRALGATRMQVLREVLAESLLLAVGGGVAGLALSAALVAIVSSATGIAADVKPVTVVWSLAASSISGLLAGWYPARRATRLDIVTAIRAD